MLHHSKQRDFSDGDQEMHQKERSCFSFIIGQCSGCLGLAALPCRLVLCTDNRTLAALGLVCLAFSSFFA